MTSANTPGSLFAPLTIRNLRAEWHQRFTGVVVETGGGNRVRIPGRCCRFRDDPPDGSRRRVA